jgi:hypothetical protein
MPIVSISAQDFYEMVGNFSYVPFTQSPAWIKARISSGKEYKFFVDDASSPSLLVAGEVYNKPILGKLLIINGGPLSNKSITFQAMTPFLKALTEDFDGVEIDSAIKYTPEFEVEVRRAGYLRPIVTANCPMTIDVAVADVNYNRIWKRTNKKAIKNEISKARVIENPTNSDIQAFIDLFKEMTEKKSLKYTPLFEEIKELLSESSMKLFVIEDVQGILAKRIVWEHGERAYDVYAANSNRSREVGATHKLLIDIFDELSQNGVKFFDFGRIGPGERSSDSVFSFKRGSGGEIISYNGHWVSYKSFFKLFLTSIYRLIQSKGNRW